MGIPTTIGSALLPGTVRSAGKMPAKTTSKTPAKKRITLVFAPLLGRRGWPGRCAFDGPDGFGEVTGTGTIVPAAEPAALGSPACRDGAVTSPDFNRR